LPKSAEPGRRATAIAGAAKATREEEKITGAGCQRWTNGSGELMFRHGPGSAGKRQADSTKATE
jgi:hypothetical protein